MPTKDSKREENSSRHRREMPKPIDDTPENIARACMKGPPKKKWDYMDSKKDDDSGKG